MERDLSKSFKLAEQSIDEGKDGRDWRGARTIADLLSQKLEKATGLSEVEIDGIRK